MDSEISGKQPNNLLRHERELHGWSQRKVADDIGATQKLVSRWERGVNLPDPYYRQKLCGLFGKNAKELGFVSTPEALLPSIEESSIAQAPEKLASQIAPWIPSLPQFFLAHPYPLQENFTGRMEERNALNTWWQNEAQQLLILQAIGGMGKSSLTWVWIQHDIPKLASNKQPDGILWWSFYETDATFGMFLDQALIYTSNKTIDPRTLPSVYEKIQTLVRFFQQCRFLIVLDGFERLLRAYATSPVSQGELPGFFRACIDPHTGNFLRWLAASSLQSKVVLTTRLAPRELDGLASCLTINLSALAAHDAQAFLRLQGIQGSRGEMQATCNFYGNHPLALRLLAGLIAHDPLRPGDVAVAVDYNPLTDLVQREHHIFTLAYDALAPTTQQLLSQIAASRSHVHFGMLKATTLFAAPKDLKAALAELIERGLLFFDKERGFYDLHPVVRQYAYARLLQKDVYHQRLAEYFQVQSGLGQYAKDLSALKKLRALLSAQDDRTDVKILDELMPIIELYYHTVRAQKYHQAFTLFYTYLASALYHRLGAYQFVIELLQGFFDQEDVLVEGLEKQQQSWLLDALANAYSASGYPQRAVILLRASVHRDMEQKDEENVANAYWNLAIQHLVLGDLASAETSLTESVTVCTAISDNYNGIKTHQYFALLKAYQGLFEECWEHLNIAFSLSQEWVSPSLLSSLRAYQSLCRLLAGDLEAALVAAKLAFQQANILHYERDIVRAEWLLGSTLTRLAMRKNEHRAERLLEASGLLEDALKRCRHIDMVDYEADILLACARFYHEEGNQVQAKAACMEALSITNRSDFRVLRADVRNFLAQLELNEGNQQQAIEHALAAKKDATCNGIPYYYRSAFDLAEVLLKQVHAYF